MANSYAAPFFSDTSKYFIKADSPEEALKKAKDEYSHPCGLYAMNVYQDANAYHKGEEALLKWKCEKATKDWT